jgi:hypothetical protein
MAPWIPPHVLLPDPLPFRANWVASHTPFLYMVAAELPQYWPHRVRASDAAAVEVFKMDVRLVNRAVQVAPILAAFRKSTQNRSIDGRIAGAVERDAALEVVLTGGRSRQHRGKDGGQPERANERCVRHGQSPGEDLLDSLHVSCPSSSLPPCF